MGVEERGIFSCEILTRYYFHNKRSFIFLDSHIHISLVNLFFLSTVQYLAAPSEEPGPWGTGMTARLYISIWTRQKTCDYFSKILKKS